MELTFLTPMAALFALSALLPLGILWRRERRAAEIRRALGVAGPGRGSQALIVASVAAVPLLLGIAAAQPVLGTTRSIPERTDAEVFFVMDTSRSMLASSGPDGTIRFDRARALALAIRDRIPQVPAGLVSMTDRVLPHAFPTTDRRVFDATLRNAIDIELPPPAFTYNTQATSLDLLAALPERHFYSPAAKKRVLVVLTDGESRQFGGELARAFAVEPPIETVFVRIGNPSERIYVTGAVEGAYAPLPNSRELLDQAASLVGGRVFEEGEASAAADRIVELVGEGETGSREIAGSRLPLMPWVALAALLPLTVLLARRNWVGRRGAAPASARAR